jgi:putative ABC transport system permease protein
VLGIALAYGGVRLLTAWLPANLPRVADIAIDLRVLFATVVAALATGTLFAIVPALHASRADVLTVLKEGGRSMTSGGPGHRLRNVLVVAEVAIAVVLLVGAGLFAGSFLRLMRIDPGFDYRNLLTLNVGVRVAPATGAAFVQAMEDASKRGGPYVAQVVEAVSRVPGLASIAVVSEGVPLSGSWNRTRMTLVGQPAAAADQDGIDKQTVNPAYFQTLRLPLRRGRTFTADDRDGATPVAIVNEAAVRKYWPGGDALGQRIVVNRTERVIVGVVGDVRHLGPENPVRHTLYVPLAQERVIGGHLVMRTSGDPLEVLPAVKAAIWSVNPEQRLTQEVVTIEGYMDRLIAQRRFNMSLLVLFGVLGLVITAAGIYGVMAYVVEQRTGEIGVRMALGATPGRVLSMVIGKAALLMTIGAAIGGVAAWQLSESVRAFLFEVEPNDVRVFVAALAVLTIAGLIASAVPARRAAAVAPVVALRQE